MDKNRYRQKKVLFDCANIVFLADNGKKWKNKNHPSVESEIYLFSVSNSIIMIY